LPATGSQYRARAKDDRSLDREFPRRIRSADCSCSIAAARLKARGNLWRPVISPAIAAHRPPNRRPADFRLRCSRRLIVRRSSAARDSSPAIPCPPRRRVDSGGHRQDRHRAHMACKCRPGPFLIAKRLPGDTLSVHVHLIPRQSKWASSTLPDPTPSRCRPVSRNRSTKTGATAGRSTSRRAPRQRTHRTRLQECAIRL